MIIFSASRLFLLLSGYGLLMIYALPTFKEHMDVLVRRFDHKDTSHLVTSLSDHSKKITHKDPATKVEKDAAGTSTGTDDKPGDNHTESNEEPNAPSANGPKIRPGILTTCDKPNQFAMTFDDGPFEYTDALLDLLIKEKFKATFFINGKNYWSGSQINPALQKAADNGFEIASHTFTHERISSLSNDEIKEEMYNNEMAIYDAIKKYPAVMRPPYGDVTEENAKYLNTLGYTVVTWSIDIQDWKTGTTLESEESTTQGDLRTPGEHNIILQHDVYQQTAKDFAPKLIEYVRAHNLEFVTVSECLGVDAYKEAPIQN